MSHTINETAPESIQISGLKFEHGTNGKYEYYYHTDHAGVLWQVWRLLLEEGRHGWYASVHQPGPGGIDAILNSYIHQESNAQSESQPEEIGDPEPSLLLCGIAGLINKGELPQYEAYQSWCIAPLAPSGNVQTTTVVFFLNCYKCMRLYALKVERADYERSPCRTKSVQDLFPYLAPPMRELLISGTCPKCWKRIFGAEDTSNETNSDSLERKGE
ncbi:MAG: hypothetical protein WBV94_34785 [Blastocatellia bacterium]